ncbi:hypothetical protein VaNZ11_001219 [Volvox africanus]|uniref:C3H1-type domain-containing protein n=1 Tax=Volvox africanus TaxID=51714 RepID=A0ABQ5RPH9_9CHLO|nr:hypothetical protein VaNZ11_001219 [Volvox africanus]
MQPSKRPRLLNEGSVEVLRSLAQDNPGHQDKLVFANLVAGADRWGTAINGTVDPGARVARTSHVPDFVPAVATATGGGFNFTRSTFQRNFVGTSSHNPSKEPQLQRRVWVRNDTKHRRQMEVSAFADQVLAIAGKHSGVQAAAVAGPAGVSPVQEDLATQRRLQRQGRLVIASAEQGKGATTATAARLTFAAGLMTSGAALPAASTQYGGTSAAASKIVAPTRAQGAARIQPLAQQVGACDGPGPSSHTGRRVWVRSPDLLAPAPAPPGPGPAAGSIDAKIAAAATAAVSGPIASSGAVSALTDAKPCPISASGVAPLATVAITSSTTNPTNIELATGAEIEVQTGATDIGIAIPTRNIGLAPVANCGVKPPNLRVQTSTVPAGRVPALKPTAPEQAILGSAPDNCANAGQLSPKLKRIPLSQSGLIQTTVAQTTPKRPAAVKPPAPTGAAPPQVQRQVGPSLTTGPTALSYFDQYLRPGRHKLIRKAAVQGSTEVPHTTRPAVVAAPAKMSLQRLQSVVVPVTECEAGFCNSDDGGRSASGSGTAGAYGPGNVGRLFGGSASNSGDGDDNSGLTSNLDVNRRERQGVVVMSLASAQAVAVPIGKHLRDTGTARTSGAPVWSPQRPRLRLQQQPMVAAAAVLPAAGAKVAPAARVVLAARLGTTLLRRGQSTWRRRISTTGAAVTGAGSRQVAPAGSGAIAVGATDASTSTVTTTTVITRPTSSVTSPVTRADEESPPRQKLLQPAPVLLRVGRAKLLAAVASPGAAAMANAPSVVGGATASVSEHGATRRFLCIRSAEARWRFPNTWSATHVPARAGGLQPPQVLRQRRAVSGGAVASRPALRSLKLVTVNGQQYYTAGPSGTGGREGVRQLHSLSSVAGKAAAAAAAAVAQRHQSATAATRRVAVASRAVRLAVWRLRGLEPISPTRFANSMVGVTSVRQDSRLSTPRRAAPAPVAASAGATGVPGRTIATVTPSTRVRKLGGGYSSVRAMAAQRILAKARMRRAAAQAVKERGYCPDYCRTGVCTLSRDLSGGSCPHTHDPTKVAVCSRWLAGSCTDANCHLQHRLVPDLMPLCTYFLQGKCNAAECPYIHKSHPSDALICRAFLHSHCPRGAACPALHLTAKMARERARFKTTGGVNVSGSVAVTTGTTATAGCRASRHNKRRLSGGGGSGAGTNAGEAAAEPPAMLLTGMALNTPKRRRGGFRYFNADFESDGGVKAEALRGGFASPGRGSRGEPQAARSVVTPASSSLPTGSRHAALRTGGGGGGAAGKVHGKNCSNGDDSTQMLLPGGIMLYL